MKHRIISVFFVAIFVVIYSPTVVYGQSVDSLINLLDNKQLEDDAEKYELLCEIIFSTAVVENRMQYCDQAIELAQKLNILPGKPYVCKGEEYLNSGNLELALEYFFDAASYFKTDGQIGDLAMAYQYIAETYNQQENYDIAKKYIRNAIEIYKQEKDSVTLAYALVNLGYTNYSMGQYDTALILFSQTGDLFKELGISSAYYYCLGNSGLVYSRLSDYDKAEEYLLTAIDTLTKLGDQRAVNENTIEIARILQHKGETEEAIAFATRGFNMAKKNDINEYARDAAETLADLYANSGVYDSAYHYQSLFKSLNDSIININSVQKMEAMRTNFEVAKKESELIIMQKEKRIQIITNILLGIILAMAIGLVVFYYYSLKRSKKLTSALEERRILLEKQSSELKDKNDKIISANEELTQLYEIANGQKEAIISSINYAQRIQQAILPPETYITELINENFISYKPKEIVSGDFYWIKQVNHYIILVCADCTGHGVPGALMSMLGISCLNEIVQRKEITQANQVLNELRREIKQSLRQTGKKEESRDGIDMALCVIDTNKSLMQYSGAYIPLYIVSNNSGSPVLKEIKADKMPVGVHFSSDTSFTNHEIKLEIGDTFYLSTDGYIDQVGGSKNTRFGNENLKKLLLKIHDQPLFEQKEILERTLNDWMGKHAQRDDILVIGARI
jgi:serine phosphatase RsbU (regulator of sigma subunit)/Tfp pilus assembly protein PilF